MMLEPLHGVERRSTAGGAVAILEVSYATSIPSGELVPCCQTPIADA